MVHYLLSNRKANLQQTAESQETELLAIYPIPELDTAIMIRDHAALNHFCTQFVATCVVLHHMISD